MTGRLFFAATALSVFAFASAASAQCDPDCSNAGPGDKVEDPRNCTQFYVCVDINEPSDHPVACEPPTGIFDPSVGECVEGESCEASCDAPACKLRCDAILDIIADPFNCSLYYFCDAASNPGPPQDCTVDRPYFDGASCTADSSVCCEAPCSPICGPGDVQIIDPTDCTKYYLCIEEGPPSSDYHYSCEPGEAFQSSSSSCVPGGECVTLCGGTTTTEITTVTTTETTTLTTTERTTTTETTVTTPSPTTTETTTVTTTIQTTTEECIVFFPCPYAGYFPMCSSCQPGYFECHEEGINGTPMLCPDGYVFNTNPDYPFCVASEDCPYTPTLSTTTQSQSQYKHWFLKLLGL